MLSFFLVGIQCSISQSILYSSTPIIHIKSFGFEEGGKFIVNIITPNISNISFFLIEEKKGFIKPSVLSKISLACTENPFFISNLNYTSNQTGINFFWSGRITNRSVYDLYSLNCNKNTSIYKIITDFQNPLSHLDYRDEQYSLIYIVLSFLYSLISLLWIINAVLYPKFWIPLHSGFAFISITKSILCSLESNLWENRKIGLINYSEYGSYLYVFFMMLHFTSFLSFPIMAMAGWCIFREKLSYKETLRIVFSNLFLVIVFLPHITSIKILAFSCVFISIFSIVFLKIIADYTLALNRLEELIPNGSDVLRKKVLLTSNFASCFIVFGMCYIIVFVLSISFDFWDIISNMIKEFGNFVIILFELYFFLFRKSYQGNKDDIVDINKEIELYYLIDPGLKDFTVVSLEKN